MKRSGSDDEPVRRLIGSGARLLVLSSILLTLLTLSIGSPASAAACHALVVKPLGERSPGSVLVMIPTALVGEDLHAGNFTASQGADPVVLQSARPLGAARLDVAIVLDTAASAPDPAYARARRLGASFLGALPPDVRVAVVSGGRSPTVLSPLTAPRERALMAVRQAGRSDGHAGVDAVALAGDQLSTGSERSRHVVLISTGNGEASQRDRAQVVSTLDKRGINLHAVGVRGDVEPSWGGQCPRTVATGQEAAAGSLLARRISDTYELVPSRADPSGPMTVRVRSGQVDASAEIAFIGPDTAVRGSRIEGPDEAGSENGMTTWILAGAIGVAVALVLLLYRLLPAMPTGGSLRHRTNRPRWLPLVQTSSAPAGLAVHPVASPPIQSPDLGRTVAVETEPESGRAQVEPELESQREDESAWATAETPSPSTPEDLRLEGWVARVCLLSVLPLAATIRVVLGHGLVATASSPVWVILGAGVVLGAAGSWWLWAATSPPYRLSPWRGGPMGSVTLARPGIAALAPFWLGVLPGALLIMLT